MSTNYHAKYFAHELTRQRATGGVDRLSQSLFDAAVDLNPHQIDAALFALNNPLSKGVLLADEVGLGKTIEASLVLCQYWAERRRRLLVVCPASIRKQWSLELEEKFNLPTQVLDAPAYRQRQREGQREPFLTPHILIVSFNFASRMQNELRAVPWDLVVIDEAHKLRNAYRASNKTGQRLRWALEDRRKLLLTATPLQNSLLELYGLSTLIGEHLFGDVASFRERYMREGGDLDDLKLRLRGFAKRTLRQDVTEYIRYTERRALTTPFSPNDEEHRLYEALSAFLQRDDTYALPNRQRQLTTLVLRKLLASSSHAVAGTLETILERLQALRAAHLAARATPEPDLLGTLLRGEEAPDEYADAVLGDAPLEDEREPEPPPTDLQKLEQEIAEVARYLAWAKGIAVDSKSQALLTALQLGFDELTKVGANRKALIFTESRRTQGYLKTFLEANGHAGRVALFNGSNAGPEAKAIFERWLAENAGGARATGSRDIDSRTAIIEHFRDHADILIATEAAAEGVNMQFCSLVVNYDLPWNPQRVEQRIGRCHRYGQQHDVVVINFLNQRNEADQRVLELLGEKFNLFSGVFGASDEVLGTVESGVDFEKRILTIYQECRTTAEIEGAFQTLRKELEASIEARLKTTRRALLEHFDEDVHERLKVQLSEAQAQLGRVERLFWGLSRVALADHARFDDFGFELHSPPLPTIARGHYTLVSKRGGAAGEFLYRFSHPLGEYAVERAKTSVTPPAELHFDVTRHPTRLAAVEALKGRSGWLTLTRLVVETFAVEDYLLFNGFADDGTPLDDELCERLFRLHARVHGADAPSELWAARLAQNRERTVQATLSRSLELNNRLFHEERERLERWADDLVLGAEKELADTKAQLRALARQARLTTTTDEQHALQLKIRDLEKAQRRQRQRIFDVEDEIIKKRDGLISDLEARLVQRTETDVLFTIRWRVV